MAINLPNYERQTEILNNTNEIIDELSRVGKTPRRQVFTTSGTWVAPLGVSLIFVTGGGGGGSGSICGSSEQMNGISGGITSFGSILSLSGGGGGIASASNTGIGGGAGGPGGQSGGVLTAGNSSQPISRNTDGGGAGYFKGGISSSWGYAAQHPSKDGGYCSGGGAIATNSGTAGGGTAGAGGSGDFVMDYPLNITPGSSYNVVIGEGGPSIELTSRFSGKGGNGILIIEWWE